MKIYLDIKPKEVITLRRYRIFSDEDEHSVLTKTYRDYIKAKKSWTEVQNKLWKLERSCLKNKQ